MRIEIKHIHEYYSTEEARIIEMAKTAKQILIMKGISGRNETFKTGENKTIKVVMIFDD